MKSPRPALFAPLIGPTFDFEKHPHTFTPLRQVEVDTKAVLERAKRHWARTRPYVLDPAIDPAVDKPHTASYPSTDAAIVSAWAVVLQQLFPEKKSELLAAKILTSKMFQNGLVAARKELKGQLRSE
jgi:acid phosphatase (class A)